MATLSSDDVHHLYRRAGFGATTAQVAALTGADRSVVIETLLSTPATDVVPRPDFAALGGDWECFMAAKQWVYDQAATAGDSVLAEKMALYWHGHFCSAEEKVGWRRMWEQYGLFRTSGLGDLRQFAKDVSVSRAMLEYLDNRWNRKGVVQENFSRELWELFLLGPGNYTQDEVVASARAWTGHSLDGSDHTGTERYVFRPEWHDDGPVTIFDATGSFDGFAVIDLTFDRRAETVSRFVARKLWTFFAYPAPDSAPPVLAVANALRARWSITDALRALFHHDAFWSDTARNGLVRSPIEYVVAVMKASGLPAGRLHPEWFERDMGQELFNPPNVSGWRPNGYWLSATGCYQRTWFARHAVWKATDALRRSTGDDRRLWLDELRALAPEDAATTVLERFSVSSTDPSTRAGVVAFITAERAERSWAETVNLARLVMASPDFQLA